MRIENLLKIIDGELENSPSVTFFDQIRIDAKQIKRADAFLCLEKSDLQTAIDNGAYAIIYSEDFPILDDEIAWIKVEDIEKTLIRYLRYKTVQTSSMLFYCDDITFQITKSITNDKGLVFLDGDIFRNFNKIINADSSSIFISNNKSFLDGIGPEHKDIPILNTKDIKLVKDSLFRSDFILDDKYYKNIKIPKIFLKFLNSSVDFLKNLNFEYNIENISIKSHFEPLFVDNEFNLKEFGETNRVLIIESNPNFLNEEVIYLRHSAKYAKSSLLLPNSFKKFSDRYKEIDIYFYQNEIDISHIKRKNYNFFLILQIEKDDILEQLSTYRQKREKTLFQGIEQ